MKVTVLKRKFHADPTSAKVANTRITSKLDHESVITGKSRSLVRQNVHSVEYTLRTHPSNYRQHNSSSSKIYLASSSCMKKDDLVKHIDNRLGSSQRSPTALIKAKHVLNDITEGFETTSVHEDLYEKWDRMNAGKLKQCSGILKKLMNHQFGWVFNQPVDPVKLKIPDYLSIITKPMDLGTVKYKLENMQYKYTVQFVEDVRLTFANAMRYNPPSNDVHIIASNLNNIFNVEWKSLEESSKVQKLQKKIKETNKNTQNEKGVVQGKASNLAVSSAQKIFIPSTKDLKTECGKTGSVYMQKDSKRSIENISKERGPNHLYTEEARVDICDAYSAEKKVPSSYEQLSPSRALRAAILKSRFTETIFKAQQKTLLDHGDSKKMHEERSRLEKKHQEEKARIEDQIKAAKIAQMENEAALRLQREKARQKARLAVQSMEKTVDIDENCGFLSDLQSFVYSVPSETFKEMMNFSDGVDIPVGSGNNPLERLGLFVKNDDVDVDIDEWISATGEVNAEEQDEEERSGMIVPE